MLLMFRISATITIISILIRLYEYDPCSATAIQTVEFLRLIRRPLISTPSIKQSTDRVPGFAAIAIGLYSLRPIWQHNDVNMWEDKDKYHIALRVVTGAMCLSWGGGYWRAVAIWEWFNAAALVVCLVWDQMVQRYVMLT